MHRIASAIVVTFLCWASPLPARQKVLPPAAPAPVSPAMTLVAQGSQFYLARNYKEAIGPYQQALDLEKQKSTLSPAIFRALVENLGVSYGLTGDRKRAQETFEYGVSRDFTYPMFHYNLACTFAEKDDLDHALAELGLAYKYKQNMIAGEEFPDPRTDDSFQRYLKNPRFLEFLKSVEQPAGEASSPQAVGDSSASPAIRGTLLRADGAAIAGAEVTLQSFRDEACAKLFDLRSDSPEASAKLSRCSQDLFAEQTNEKGEFAFVGVQAGWYAVRFLWNIEPKPTSGPSADHVGGFLVVYAAQKDVSGRYDTLSQGPAFHFEAVQDYRTDFKY
jgi:tetratricopeptide (TPR) repeat protein